MTQERVRVGRHLLEIRPLREALLLAVALSALWAVYRFRSALVPAFAGFLLAYIFHPAVKFLHIRLKLPRWAVSALITAGGLALTALVLVSILPLVIEQGYAFLREFPGYIENARKTFLAWYGVAGETALSGLQPEPQQLLDLIGGIVNAASSAVFWALFLPFFFFMFSWRFPLILRCTENLIPEKGRKRALEMLRRVDRVFANFFRGRLIVCSVAGVLLAAGWFFAAVPYWLLLGLITGFIGIAPYLSMIGWAAAVLLKLLAGGSGDPVAVFVLPSVVFIGVNIIEEWVLTPWIQSKTVDLSPVTIVLAVLSGGALAGIWGLLFAIPAAGVIKVLIQGFRPASVAPGA